MSERFGPREFGGYQTPSVNAVGLTRGRPVRALRWQRGDLAIELALVPLEGGRPELFEVEYQWNDPIAKQNMYCPCILRGERWAREAFAGTAADIDAGGLPDQVLTAPGTPLGP
jgi:hypothetical protein